MQWTSLLVPLILLGIAFMLLPSIESNKKTVLIVGGGAAGMAAGLELSENEDLEIIIFDKGLYNMFYLVLESHVSFFFFN